MDMVTVMEAHATNVNVAHDKTLEWVIFPMLIYVFNQTVIEKHGILHVVKI